MASTTTYVPNGLQTTFTNSVTKESFTVDFSQSKLATPPTSPILTDKRYCLKNQVIFPYFA